MQSTKTVTVCVCVSILSGARVLNQAQHKTSLSYVNRQFVLCSMFSWSSDELTCEISSGEEQRWRERTRGVCSLQNREMKHIWQQYCNSPAGQGTGWRTNLIKLTNKLTYHPDHQASKLTINQIKLK